MFRNTKNNFKVNLQKGTESQNSVCRAGKVNAFVDKTEWVGPRQDWEHCGECELRNGCLCRAAAKGPPTSTINATRTTTTSLQLCTSARVLQQGKCVKSSSKCGVLPTEIDSKKLPFVHLEGVKQFDLSTRNCLLYLVLVGLRDKHCDMRG